MKIFFRVEATPELGLGHLMRCLVLAKRFKESASDINIIFITSNNIIDKQVISHDYKLINLPSFRSMIDEIEYYKKHLKEGIFITDIPNISMEYLRILKKRTCLVVSIDDGSDIIFYSDILISPNLDPKINHKYSSETQYYNGAKYIILKKAFEKYKIKKKQIEKEAKSLFICFGGSDKNNITKKIINAIKELKIKIVIVIGTMYLYYNELVNNVKKYKNIQIKRSVYNMDELIYEADLAIISGGTLLYETCTVGTPAIVICQNREQKRESNFFAASNSVINLGIFDNLNEDIIRNTITKLIFNYNTRKELSKNAKQLINGKGADRIVNIILKEYLKRRTK